MSDPILYSNPAGYQQLGMGNPLYPYAGAEGVVSAYAQKGNYRNVLRYLGAGNAGPALSPLVDSFSELPADREANALGHRAHLARIAAPMTTAMKGHDDEKTGREIDLGGGRTAVNRGDPTGSFSHLLTREFGNTYWENDAYKQLANSLVDARGAPQGLPTSVTTRFQSMMQKCNKENWDNWSAEQKDHAMTKFLKCMSFGVKYYSAETVQEKFQIDFSGGILKRRDAVFDTSAVGQASKAKGYLQTSNAGLNGVEKRCIWVMNELDMPAGERANADGNVVFASHTNRIGRVHHSSLAGGGEIQAAGEWVVEGGKIKTINGCSGHYRPEPFRFVRALKRLQAKGALTDETQVQLFDRNGAAHMMNANQFLADPMGAFGSDYTVAPGGDIADGGRVAAELEVSGGGGEASE